MFPLILKEDRELNPDLNHVPSSSHCRGGNKLEAFTSEVNQVTAKTHCPDKHQSQQLRS